MIKLIILSLLLVPGLVSASICKMESYSFLYRFNQFDRNVIKSTDCSQDKILQFLSYINLASTKNLTPETLYTNLGIFVVNHEIRIEDLTEFLSTPNTSIRYKINDIIASTKFIFSDTPIHIKNNSLRIDLGRFNVELNTSLGNVFVNYSVQKETIALIAKRDLSAHGLPLSENDFETKTILLEHLNLLPLNNVSQVNHMQLNRNIKAGDIITNNMLYYPELIKFGDIIKTQVNSGGISLEFNARALRPGKLNEIIQLENLNSKKSFAAQVVGHGKIKVLL
jgi:flagella basal body P-ring formation protein FlgA